MPLRGRFPATSSAHPSPLAEPARPVRPERRSSSALLLGLLLSPLVLGLAAPSAAAEIPGLIVDFPDHSVEVEAGDVVTITIAYQNVLRSNLSIYMAYDVDAPDGWEVTVPEPTFLEIPSRGSREESITVVPMTGGRTAFTDVISYTVTIIDSRTGNRTQMNEEFLVRVLPRPLVFDVFPNPLPEPLDGRVGVFVIEVTSWAFVALLAIFVGDTAVKYLTRHARYDVTRLMVAKYRRPLFLLVVLLGLDSSLTLLPQELPGVDLTDRILDFAVLITGLYVGFTIIDAALLYYRHQIAPRTATKVDDVLVPVLRKFFAIALFVVGFAQAFELVGIDITVLVAGAGIAGIAIAFAAQDTISNFFSGIFLLVDRPFQEGDDIILESGEVVRVDSVGLRSTRFYHYRNHEIFVIPNRKLADSRITNIMRPDVQYRIMVEVGVAYGTPLATVKDALLAAGTRHPHVLQATDLAPIVLFTGFGASSLDFVLRCAVDDVKIRFRVMSELREMIVEEFEKRDIEIPFPQRTLWFGQKGTEEVMDAAMREAPEALEGGA